LDNFTGVLYRWFGGILSIFEWIFLIAGLVLYTIIIAPLIFLDWVLE